MGIEYKILCEPEVVKKFDTFLRQRFSASFDEKYQLYYLRMAGPDKPWDGPDAWVSLQEDGLYFCDNLSSPNGEADRILRALIDEILKWSQTVTITEL